VESYYRGEGGLYTVSKLLFRFSRPQYLSRSNMSQMVQVTAIVTTEQ